MKLYCLSVIHLFICSSIYPSICQSIYPSICLSIYSSICPSIYLSIHLSIYLSIHLSIYLSIHLFIYLSVRLIQTYFSFSLYVSSNLDSISPALDFEMIINNYNNIIILLTVARCSVEFSNSFI